ncbi:MAG: hypothetical protein A4E65_03029 [Syntrophorhabdus sp. PtaU1.Bin153]|nr:MAG: hypothetical protein A4E65_03029 [Syntrophorhabdus sp. PtaU1.Bin153]
MDKSERLRQIHSHWDSAQRDGSLDLLKKQEFALEVKKVFGREAPAVSYLVYALGESPEMAAAYFAPPKATPVVPTQTAAPSTPIDFEKVEQRLSEAKKQAEAAGKVKAAITARKVHLADLARRSKPVIESLEGDSNPFNRLLAKIIAAQGEPVSPDEQTLADLEKYTHQLRLDRPLSMENLSAVLNQPAGDGVPQWEHFLCLEETRLQEVEEGKWVQS